MENSNRENHFKISKESVDKLFPKTDIDIFGYKSPIEIYMGQMRIEQENNIVRAVQNQDINVDKDELIKALQYDREQYEKGYINGYNAGYRKQSEVAREIFEEIGELVNEYLDGRIYTHDFCTILSELKKKYTESEKYDG